MKSDPLTLFLIGVATGALGVKMSEYLRATPPDIGPVLSLACNAGNTTADYKLDLLLDESIFINGREIESSGNGLFTPPSSDSQTNFLVAEYGDGHFTVTGLPGPEGSTSLKISRECE